MRSKALSLAALFGGLLVAGPSCRAATELTLIIRTNVSCAQVKDWRGVAVYVGKPGAESADQAPTLVTQECEADGRIGSLVVVPSGAKDDSIGVRVVAGTSRNPEECAANDYRGCIVARRAIRFTPHSGLDLHVELQSSCLDIGCDAQKTCIDRRCEPTSAVAPAPLPSGGGGGGGSGPTSPSMTGEGWIRCGDDGVFCPTSGDVCCLTVDREAQSTRGECLPPTLCQGIVLHCDDGTDCPDGGPDMAWKGVCVLSYPANDETPYVPSGPISSSQCLIGNSGSTEKARVLGLCEEELPCANQFQCLSSGLDSPLPGYSWCHLKYD
jgi:hypothetical protein